MSCQIHVYDCLKIYMSIHHHNNNVEMSCMHTYAKGLCLGVNEIRLRLLETPGKDKKEMGKMSSQIRDHFKFGFKIVFGIGRAIVHTKGCGG